MVSNLKIAVVNDLSPETNPGAASIAYSFAKNLTRHFEYVEFWTTGSTESGFKTNDGIEMKIQKFSDKKIRRQDNSLKFRLIAEFWNIKNLFWFILQVTKSRPNIVWVHQIGFRFPKTILVVCKIMKLKTFITLHDYNLIVPRKLFPMDLYPLKIASVNPLQGDGNKTPKSVAFSSDSFSQRKYFAFRRSVLCFLYNSLTGTFAISEQQKEIYSDFGFRITSTIANGFDECNCGETSKIERTILFAGRENGKGLSLALEAAKKNSWVLHLAGDSRLKDIVSEKMNPTEYEFHGKLSQEELFSLIHKMEFVAVLSQCYDVYPSIAIEALVHGSLPLITRSCGNWPLISNISSNLVIPAAQVPDLEWLRADVREKDTNVKVSALEISDVQESLRNYLYFFR